MSNQRAKAIERIRQVKEYIRAPYAWPGGYTKILVMHDGEVLCSDCARADFRLIVSSTRTGARDGWQAEGVTLHQEGPALYCANCNKYIPSDYGDPDRKEDPSITVRDILHDDRSEFKYDPWGSCMGWLFAIADYLSEQGEPVPDEWRFRQAPGGADKESYSFQTLQELSPTMQTVQRLGAILWRYRGILERAGRSY